MYIYNSEEGMYYYRTGLTDNTYDVAKKTVKGDTEVVTKAKYAVLKTIFGMMGNKINKCGEISLMKFEEKMKNRYKAANVQFKEVSPGKQVITDYRGTIGSVTNDMADHLRRYSYDSHKLFLDNLDAEGKDKKLRKKLEKNERKLNREESDYYLYHIDDEGNYGPEDLVMLQNMTSWDRKEDDSLEHIIIAMQVFTTDRAYVTKDELNERKKANKMKMNYANIRQFERDHNIPALVPAVQEKLNELWKIGE